LFFTYYKEIPLATKNSFKKCIFDQYLCAYMKRKALTTAEKSELLQRAEYLGNVAAACREANVSYRLFFKIKQQALEGQLEPKDPTLNQPQRTPFSVEDRIIELSLLFPESARAIQEQLGYEGYDISIQTIQKILNRHQLGQQQDRFNRLILQIESKGLALTPSQTEFIARFNPAWLEWKNRATRPGELLIQYTHFLGRWPVLGKVFLYVLYEAWSGWVCALVGYGKFEHWPKQLLETGGIPLSRQFNFKIQSILSADSAEYFVPGVHGYRQFLAMQQIRHQLATINGERIHGYTWRFQQWLEQECIPKWKQANYLLLDELNEAVQRDLSSYNSTEGKVLWPSHYLGFPHDGQTPVEKLSEFALKD
jgi:hypothetical protein